jgi:molybdate transport system substrate-binding protein
MGNRAGKNHVVIGYEDKRNRLLTSGGQGSSLIQVLSLVVMALFGLLLLSWHTEAAQLTSQPTGRLIVFAAASLTEPFTTIGKRLETSYPGLQIIYNFGGSPAIRTQLEQGAHADVFASADVLQMEYAQQSGVVQGEPLIFAQNTLVVIVPQANPGNIGTFRDLAKPGLKLALANPVVPAGHYSRQVLYQANEAYGPDFAQHVLRNLVSEEENVKHVVAKVQLGEVDAGMVYVSDVTSAVGKEVLVIPIPEAYNRIATYPIAMTRRLQNHVAAAVFINFVRSTEGQAILKAHHFIPVIE